MNVVVSFRNFDPSGKEKSFVQENSKQFEEYFNNIVSIEWDLYSQRMNKVARCRLHSASGYYRAEASSKDCAQSINLVFKKLTKQRRRKKKMRKSAMRRSRAKGFH